MGVLSENSILAKARIARASTAARLINELNAQAADVGLPRRLWRKRCPWFRREALKESRRAWPRRPLVEMALCGSPFDGVAALPVVALGGHELELHPLRDRA